MGPLGGALPSGTGSGSFREPRALPLPSAAWDPLRSLRPGRGPSPTPRAPRSQPSGLQNREVCKSPGPPWFLRRPEDTKTGREQGRLRDTPRSRGGGSRGHVSRQPDQNERAPGSKCNDFKQRASPWLALLCVGGFARLSRAAPPSPARLARASATRCGWADRGRLSPTSGGGPGQWG